MTEQEALGWIANLFNQPPETVTPTTARDTMPEWDSLGVLTLMAALDERFGILLADDAMKAMTQVDDILQVLRTHGKLQ